MWHCLNVRYVNPIDIERGMGERRISKAKGGKCDQEMIEIESEERRMGVRFQELFPYVCECAS